MAVVERKFDLFLVGTSGEKGFHVGNGVRIGGVDGLEVEVEITIGDDVSGIAEDGAESGVVIVGFDYRGVCGWHWSWYWGSRLEAAAKASSTERRNLWSMAALARRSPQTSMNLSKRSRSVLRSEYVSE